MSEYITYNAINAINSCRDALAATCCSPINTGCCITGYAISVTSIDEESCLFTGLNCNLGHEFSVSTYIEERFLSYSSEPCCNSNGTYIRNKIESTETVSTFTASYTVTCRLTSDGYPDYIYSGTKVDTRTVTPVTRRSACLASITGTVTNIVNSGSIDNYNGTTPFFISAYSFGLHGPNPSDRLNPIFRYGAFPVLSINIYGHHVTGCVGTSNHVSVFGDPCTGQTTLTINDEISTSVSCGSINVERHASRVDNMATATCPAFACGTAQYKDEQDFISTTTVSVISPC